MRTLVLSILVMASACGEDDSVVEEAPSIPAPATDEGLLARARDSIREGQIDPELRARILASDQPKHARARRLLQAMESDPRARTESDAVPLHAPENHRLAANGQVGSSPRSGSDTQRRPRARTSEPASPARESAKKAARIRRVSLGPKGADEAILTIHGDAGIVVGVANQPKSGLVRLVVDATAASGRVLQARPRAGGATVTNVQQGTDSVIITLQLEPGWRFSGVRKFAGGARVKLRASGGG